MFVKKKSKSTVKLVRITSSPISMRLLITGQPAYMHAAGFEVSLISGKGDAWEYIPDLQNYNVSKVDMTRDIDIRRDIKTLFTLIRLFRELRPEIVHTHTPKAGLLGMLAAWVTRVPVRIHTLAGLRLITEEGLKRKILYMVEMLTFFTSNEVWPNSAKLKHYILTHKMVSSSKVRMILNGSSNGIDLAKYSKDVLDESRLDVLKKQYAVTTDNFCFLAVGRMVRDKGIVELVTAFLDIYKDYPETRLFLLGPFEQVGAVPGDIVEQINAHPAIVYVKWSDEVEYFMALAKCLVHASHREGFPNVVLQAAAMGTPIICSDISGNTDIVQDNKEGYLYPVKDIAALEKTMQEVVSNYEIALKKAEILKQKVIVNYDRTAVHKAIKERYINLLVNKQIDVSEIN